MISPWQLSIEIAALLLLARLTSAFNRARRHQEALK